MPPKRGTKAQPGENQAVNTLLFACMAAMVVLRLFKLPPEPLINYLFMGLAGYKLRDLGKR